MNSPVVFAHAATFPVVHFELNHSSRGTDGKLGLPSGNFTSALFTIAFSNSPGRFVAILGQPSSWNVERAAEPYCWNDLAGGKGIAGGAAESEFVASYVRPKSYQCPLALKSFSFHRFSPVRPSTYMIYNAEKCTNSAT